MWPLSKLEPFVDDSCQNFEDYGRANFGVKQLPLFNLLKPEDLDWLVCLLLSEGGRWLNTRVPRNLHSHEVILMVDDVENGLTNSIWRKWQKIVGDSLKYVIQKIWRGGIRDGLKDAIQKIVDFMRYSFMGIPIPVVKEESAEECWSLSWEIEFRSFSFPLLYWSGSRLHSDLLGKWD